MPVWFLIYVKLNDQGISSPMYGAANDLNTIVAHALIAGLPFLWMLIGVYVLWNARSPLIQGVVYAVFTIPALLGVIFGPATIPILQNLS